MSIRQWLCIDKIYWKGKSYSITQPEGEIFISEGYYTKDCKYYNALSNEECIDIEGMRGDTTDEILEYIVGGDKLRDIITQIEVVDRTI